MSRIPCALLVSSLLGSCLVVPEGAKPEVLIGAQLASEYNFRGMTNNERGVLQTEMEVVLPTKLETGSISLRGWANWDLQDSTGDAWFPDGHEGEPTQFDTHLAYTEEYRGFDLTTGFISYALQNPDDFPLTDERGETKELFANVSRLVAWGLVPSLTIHYDFDEVDGWYFNGAVAREFPIDEKFVADASLSLGYSDEDQSDWNYGLPESGLADLRATGRVSYLFDAHTTLHASLNGSTMVDEDLRDWFDDDINVDPDTFWITLGVTWAY
jgi:hypothetical protein